MEKEGVKISRYPIKEKLPVRLLRKLTQQNEWSYAKYSRKNTLASTQKRSKTACMRSVRETSKTAAI